MLWTQPGGLLGWDCSKAAGAGTPSPSCMPMCLTWSAAGSVEGTGEPVGAVASQVAGKSGRARLPRPPSLPDCGFTFRLSAGLRVRVTPVQRGRWKERRLPGGIGARQPRERGTLRQKVASGISSILNVNGSILRPIAYSAVLATSPSMDITSIAGSAVKDAAIRDWIKRHPEYIAAKNKAGRLKAESGPFTVCWLRMHTNSLPTAFSSTTAMRWCGLFRACLTRA